MNKILIIGEHEGGKLNASIAKCVKCAQAIPDGEITVLVLAADSAAVAGQAAAIAGVAKVLRVDHPANAHALAAVLAPQIAAVAAPFTHVFGPSTTFGKDLMPRVAALLNAPQLSDIMAAESATRFVGRLTLATRSSRWKWRQVARLLRPCDRPPSKQQQPVAARQLSW